ncbi:FAS1-like dehydratase domain-containing protein [Blastococcus sp. SYSU DS0616]
MSLLDEVAAQLREKIGNSQRHDHGVVDRRLIQRYAVAIDDREPIFSDPDHARAAGFDDVVAPPNMLAGVIDWGPGDWQDELKPDGTGDEGWLSEATRGMRVMGGGEQTELLHPLVAGMRLIETQTLADVVVKEGRAGRLLLIHSDVTFEADGGPLLSRSRRTVLGREPVEEATA